MAHVSQDKYSPWPRVCDICGKLDSINLMRKLDGQTWVCWKHPGERTAIMLDTLNAHARPPQTWPNRDAKPQNPEYPNTLEADEGALFDFLDRQIQAVARYESITAGQAPAASMGGIVSAMSWTGRYLYGLIVEGTRLTLLDRANALLLQVADYLRSRQTAISTASSLATDPFYGGVLESGASTYVTEDTANAGLTFLYAYRLTGTLTWSESAVAAASYLRNVQAIGSDGTQYTSSDSAGTARLYTGSLASQVSTVSGFYSNHLFYPSALVALEFWNELQTTLGDMTIGATGVATGFSLTPSQLLSQSITDLRTCWEDGIRDSVGVTLTGLSSTTPREYFNAYPQTKANFVVTGTGRWEFADAGASTGTMITAQNFAIALGSLFAVDGQSDQVGTVSDWLRTFESNEDFETPDDTSASVLARSTTGEYDPTVCLSTLLLVRDSSDSYTEIAENASSLYDWGAFGVLAPLWFARYATSFKSARLNALNLTRRYDDGTPSDGLYFDRIQLRGMSGLTFQTGVGYDGREGQGPDLEWDEAGGTDIPSGLSAFDYYVFTTVDDAGAIDTLNYADVSGGECPNGGLLTLGNETGSDRAFTTGGTATAGRLPFYLNGPSSLTFTDGDTVDFVRDDARGAWVLSSGLFTNDGTRAAQFGRTYRSSH